jgi:NAD(P)-dependent dehydrogenase (short-subunit alcohol dehydrogenase family)
MKRIVLVTGASSGIGRAVAVRLAGSGFTVYGASRSGSGPKMDSLTNVQMDVTKVDSVVRVLNEIDKNHGALHAVINSAGLGMLGSLEDSTTEEIQMLFETNLIGVHHVCMRSLHLLRRTGNGYIINITSMAAQMGLPYRGVYCASKFAVEGYSESLSQEVACEGIHVVIVEPGDVRTAINGNRKEVGTISNRHATRHQTIRQQVNREVDLGMNPEGVANTICSILHTNKPRLRYRVAFTRAKLAYYLMRILPDRWFERIVMKHYKIGVKRKRG